MMRLPNETKLDALKFLKFDQLSDIKLTNRSLLGFVDRHSDVLPIQGLHNIELLTNAKVTLYQYINSIDLTEEKYFVEEGQDVDEFERNLPQIQDMVRADKIPLFINSDRLPLWVNVEFSAILIFVTKTNEVDQERRIELPCHPKDEKDLRYIRYWLKQLSSVHFERFDADLTFFNPDLIRLLFPAETGKFSLRFSASNFSIFVGLENNLRFADFCTKCVRAAVLYFDFDSSFDGILDLALNQAENIGKIFILSRAAPRTFYNLLIEHAESSRNDGSKMVRDIECGCNNIEWPNVRSAGIIERRDRRFDHTDYELKNQDFPHLVYGISITHRRGFRMEHFRIWLKQS